MVFANWIVEFEHPTSEDLTAELDRIPHLTVLARCDARRVVVVIEGRDHQQVRDVVDFTRQQVPGIVAIDPDDGRPATRRRGPFPELP